eukprot:5563651-Prymnesium_polylepis.1
MVRLRHCALVPATSGSGSVGCAPAPAGRGDISASGCPGLHGRPATNGCGEGARGHTGGTRAVPSCAWQARACTAGDGVGSAAEIPPHRIMFGGAEAEGTMWGWRASRVICSFARAAEFQVCGLGSLRLHMRDGGCVFLWAMRARER